MKTKKKTVKKKQKKPLDLDQLEEQFNGRSAQIQQLFEDVVHISDGIPNGSVLIVLMNLTIILFQEIGVGKEDAISFFHDACDENWKQE